MALALLAVALAPVAAAHSHVESDDGRYEFTIGLLNEPVVTYDKTGLDLCVKQMPANHDELEAQGIQVQGTAVAVDVSTVTVTLWSPSGQSLSQPLKAQFGRVGCYQFLDPIVLTLQGQYTVDVAGTVNGTALRITGIKAGGAVGNESSLTFPASHIDSLETLSTKQADHAAELAKLRQQVAGLSSEVTAMKKAQSTGAQGAPGLSLVGVLLALGGVALARRRA